MQQIFIDKFIIPQASKNEFLERMNINRSFIKKQPGFVGDSAYERIDEKGNLVCVTIAIWENEDVLKSAKEAVQAEYKKQGFNLAAMLERLNITIERGAYTKM
jgi:heme-degrading monooxygenase HmoA